MGVWIHILHRGAYVPVGWDDVAEVDGKRDSSQHASIICQSGLSYSYPKATVAKWELNDFPHHLLHFGTWSHFLEDLGVIWNLPGPRNACTSLLLSAALAAQGQRRSRDKLCCLIPGSHQSMPFPLPFPTFFSSCIMRPPETGGRLNLVMALLVVQHQ